MGSSDAASWNDFPSDASDERDSTSEAPGWDSGAFVLERATGNQSARIFVNNMKQQENGNVNATGIEVVVGASEGLN